MRDCEHIWWDTWVDSTGCCRVFTLTCCAGVKHRSRLTQSPTLRPFKSLRQTIGGKRQRCCMQTMADLTADLKPVTDSIVIKGGKGKAAHVKTGDTIKIVNTHGSQVKWGQIIGIYECRPCVNGTITYNLHLIIESPWRWDNRYTPMCRLRRSVTRVAEESLNYFVLASLICAGCWLLGFQHKLLGREIMSMHHTRNAILRNTPRQGV